MAETVKIGLLNILNEYLALLCWPI